MRAVLLFPLSWYDARARADPGCGISTDADPVFDSIRMVHFHSIGSGPNRVDWRQEGKAISPHGRPSRHDRQVPRDRAEAAGHGGDVVAGGYKVAITKKPRRETPRNHGGRSQGGHHGMPSGNQVGRRSNIHLAVLGPIQWMVLEGLPIALEGSNQRRTNLSTTRPSSRAYRRTPRSWGRRT